METTRALADLTDEGLFEIIATSVLRIADARCSGLSHPGVNAAGRTRRSPVDGVTYAPGDPNHLIIIHHTTASKLRPKWLLDPSTVRRRSSNTPPAVAGDIVKTAELVAERRRANPALQATLFLTTNQEVDEPLFSDAVTTAAAAGLGLDIWTGSRLAQVLDTTPDGQWIRRTHLGIRQEILSADLLRRLSADGLDRFSVGDDPEKRVPRALDRILAQDQRPLIFLAAPSGTGKSVACFRALEAHVSKGGFGLVLGHELIERSSSLDQAVLAALQDVEPALTAAESVLSIPTPNDPLFLLVEDISRAPDPGRLLDRLTLWTTKGDKAEQSPNSAVKIFCPIWPHLLALGGQALEGGRRGALLEPPPMSPDEGRDCVICAAAVDGESLSIAAAESIAMALGNDPLLIGLNEDWAEPSAAEVIARFMDAALERAAGASRPRAAGLRASLLRLGREMMLRRRLNPTWAELLEWSLGAQTYADLDVIAGSGEILRLDGALDAPSLRFRHDRVRGWILLRATQALFADGLLGDVIAEPAFAEILAELLIESSALPALRDELATHNPLALFHALRLAQESPDLDLEPIVQAATAWLRAGGAEDRAFQHLRWEAMAALRRTQGDFVSQLLDAFPNQTVAARLGKLRNGDIEGGLTISERHGIHVAASWLPTDLRIARQRRGDVVVNDIAQALVTSLPNSRRRTGLLVLAGVSGAPELTTAVARVWEQGQDQLPLLAAYLWAFARCVTPQNAASHLDPVCSLWAKLPAPKQGEEMSGETTIYNLAAHEVRSGFKSLPPEGALDYFFDRAQQADLSWPIQYMLHEIDHPAVVDFIARSLAQTRRHSPADYSMSGLRALHWRGFGDESWPPMSDASREVLRSLWQDPGDDDLRIAAFDWWCASRDPRDLPLLARVPANDVLAERALGNRLRRGDVRCHAALVEKLQDPEGAHWWFYAGSSWSPALAHAFETELAARAENRLEHHDGPMSFEFAGIFARMSRVDAERLLLRYWEAFETAPRFLLIALYIGTPELLRRVEKAICEHPNPKDVFEWFGPVWGIQHADHPGLTRKEQVLALSSYLHFLGEGDLSSLAHACDEKGWFDIRRRLIDPLMPTSHVARTTQELQAKFDRAIDAKFLVDRDVDFAIATGLTRADIMHALCEWISRSSEERALELGAEVVRHVGDRADVDILMKWAGLDGETLARVVSDTRFAVARRTA